MSISWATRVCYPPSKPTFFAENQWLWSKLGRDLTGPWAPISGSFLEGKSLAISFGNLGWLFLLLACRKLTEIRSKLSCFYIIHRWQRQTHTPTRCTLSPHNLFLIFWGIETLPSFRGHLGSISVGETSVKSCHS